MTTPGSPVGAPPLSLPPILPASGLWADRGSLNTPTHSLQPNRFALAVHKLFIFCYLVAAPNFGSPVAQYASEDKSVSQ